MRLTRCLSLAADCSSSSIDSDTDCDDTFESDTDCDVNGGFATEELTLGPGLRVHVMSASESAFNYEEIFKQVGGKRATVSVAPTHVYT